jgi:hypothetical protein
LSANFCSTFLRGAGERAAQRPSANAARALATAASISGCRPRATAPSTRPSIGEMQSKVSPLAAPTLSPPITARPSMRSVAERSRQVGVAVVFMIFSFRK